MNEINAIAHKVIQEAMRLKTPLLSFIAVVALLIYFPFSLRGDGTVLGHTKLLLLYSSMLLFALLAIQTMYLSTLSFSQEIKHKQFFLIDVKPIARWKFFVGKLWGLAILNLCLLVILGLITVTTIHFFGYGKINPKQKKKFQNQFYTASAAAKFYFPEEEFEKDVESRYKRMAEEAKIDPNMAKDEAKQRVRNKLRQALQYIPVGQGKVFIFKDFPKDLRKKENAEIRIRYKIYSPNATYGFRIRTKWIVGAYAKYSVTGETEVGEFDEISIPANAIDANGNLEVLYINQHNAAGSLFFPIEDGIEVLYPQGSFIANYAKFLFLIFIVLNLLSAISLFFATFLSFPVAILTSLFIFKLGILLDFLREMAITGADILVQERQSFLSFLYEQYFVGLNMIVPNFSQYLAFEHITTGRYIDWLTLAQAFIFLVIIDCGLLVAFGSYIFYRREVAKPLL
ncbi:hypothetical protein [Candidatus Uabimicrobium sp. HlEnr_7]|uniref:hypothetical protein n=1 Tax=Candidatus Uabimicrobium helgolandensis TaxID=3095367 RepID=UPI00355769B7